ncbi:hypothetical protein [Nocardia sp. NPDC058666]|uniref:hypothetical protein n=1 Tax=Nocardia sp. NPDC058666 TaxID=3346587 RepID=UPI00364716BA
MLSVEEFDALSRAEKFTAMRLEDDHDFGMPSVPSQKEIDAYLAEGKTPPEPGPGPFRARLSSLQTDISSHVEDGASRRSA